MIKFLLTFFLGVGIILTPSLVQGQGIKDINKQLEAGGKNAGLTKDGKTKDPRALAADIIQILLTLVGMICIILVVTAGFWYLTSHGDSDKVTKAKDTLAGAVIGLAITLAAYSITIFVSKRIYNATQNVPGYDLNENSFPPGGGSKIYDIDQPIKDAIKDSW